ncbi:hypothetical protein [Ekhidna sp.]
MSSKNHLRPVIIRFKGKEQRGFFHRFVYSSSNYHSVTQALVELTDGRLKYFDPYFIQFTDRQLKEEELKNSKKNDD